MADSSSSFNRKASVYLAKLAEKSKCYSVMVEEITALAKEFNELTEQEMYLITTAYCNRLEPLLDSWRKFYFNYNCEEIGSREDADEIEKRVTGYNEKMVEEITTIFKNLMDILDRNLIVYPISPYDNILSILMRGDYHRFLMESGHDYVENYQKALQAYEEAEKMSTDFKPEDPERLLVASKLSAFYYETIDQPIMARQVAQKALDMAEAMILSDKEGVNIFEALQNSLTMWKLGGKTKTDEGGKTDEEGGKTDEEGGKTDEESDEESDEEEWE